MPTVWARRLIRRGRSGKQALSGLRTGVGSYNGGTTFVAGGHVAAVFPVGLSIAQVVSVDRLIRTTLA
jgi:hypothetical protein